MEIVIELTHAALSSCDQGFFLEQSRERHDKAANITFSPEHKITFNY